MAQTFQLLAACALGALLMYGYLFLRGRENAEVKRLQAKLTAKTDELAAYKSDVREHFLGTAEVVGELADLYKNVVEQLERDAHRLVGEAHFRASLGERRALGRSTPEVAAVKEDEVPDTPASAPVAAPTLSPSRQV
ncbi:MAG: hypothetical protein AVDCRST_MAG86-4406 [uncultured Truepera sp.]|uniref:DUF1043 family protein n=1 Tax=uncultured Truepera sp. TaxID=543023 RepID=A0A6J4VTN2_9DEIN|nr:MAG: hypothetical protein AVDCRST_MAG86-4406 [uncultured Truepera sp.]